MEKSRPRAYFAHEVGHLRTQGRGPAANFLAEGWAAYVESLFLAQKYGSDLATLYWKSLAEESFRQFDGKASLLDDPDNSGVAYQKGAWIFRMLESTGGQANFDTAMAEFSRQSLERPAGWEDLAACFDKLGLPEFDARAFLWPWPGEKTAPSLSAKIDGSGITVSQGESSFRLPVTIEVTTANGTERRKIWLHDKDTFVNWPYAPGIINIDRDRVLLLKR